MADLSAKAQKALGLPEGFKQYTPFPFAGMNVQASPTAIEDQEFTYIENFVRLGDGYLRTLWDKGSSIYTAPPNVTIVYYYFFTIGATYYCAVFLSDGSAVQVAMSDLTTTLIGPKGTFYLASSGIIPACSQYGTKYLLISNRNTNNDYWAWDGALLYGAGTVRPDGTVLTSGGFGYRSLPTITVHGGRGSGLVVVPTIQGGSVIMLTITNPGSGYQANDSVQLAFSGGGTDKSAFLTAVLTPSTVAGAIVTANGSGYTNATVFFSGGGGSGAAGTAVITAGKITDITITAIGSGYTSAPAVQIVGDGTGALAVAQLDATGVASVTVVDGGTNFVSPPGLTFVGGGGAGASGVAILNGTTIDHFDVTGGGTGYTSVPTVVVNDGGGASGAGTAIIANGQVVGITLTNAGSGYTSPPPITFTGGGGTGAGAVAVLNPTKIQSVQVSASGQFYTDAPSVQVSAGENNAAYATVVLMPYGISGDSMETYQQRVWIYNPAPNLTNDIPVGGDFAVSAPGSISDFATSDGGVLFTSTDSFLQTKYTGVKQSNGYLYAFGDGSVSVISNVQTSGSPSTTTFGYQNVDPQSGLSWRDSRQDFGRSMLLANETGIYGLYGGSLTKVSGKLDQLFVDAIFPPTAGAITPSAAVATIFNIKHYACLMTVRDPDTMAYRNVMLTWNERDWVITSQTIDLTYIGTQKVSSKLNAYGTDGTDIYPMFQTPSAALTKRLNTKFYGGDRAQIFKDLYGVWMMAQDKSAGQSGIVMTVDSVMSGTAVQLKEDASVESQVVPSQWTLNQQPSFSSAPPFWGTWAAGTPGVPFVALGVRLSSNSPDFALSHLAIGYSDRTAIF